LYPDNVFTPGQTLTSSAQGQAPYEINFDTTGGAGSWELEVDANVIGGWPDDTWNGGFYTDVCNGTPNCTLGANGLPAGMFVTQGAPLSEGASLFQVGGEVAVASGEFNSGNGSANAVQMGSSFGGIVGSVGLNNTDHAAYFRNIELYYGSGNYAEGAAFSGLLQV